MLQTICKATALLDDPGPQQGHRLHPRGAPPIRAGRAAAAFGGTPRPAGRARHGASRRQADRPRALHLSDRPLGPERDAVLPHGHVRSGALHPDPLRSDRRRRLPRLRPHLPPRARHVHHTRDEGPHRRGAAQLAGARRALHLRLDRRAHPRPRRHRRQRHGHPDRQAAALYGVRRGAARPACCRCCSTSARPTRRCAPIRSISACARSRPPRRNWTSWSRNSCRRCRRCSPGCCIHFEDWKGTDAIRMLDALRRQGAVLQRRHPGHRQRRARRADHGAADRRARR